MKLQLPSKRTWEFLFVIGVLFLSTLTALYAAVWLKPGMVLTTAILHVLAAATAIWQVLKEGKSIDFKKLLRRSWFLLPFAAYAFISIFWSIHWNISLFRSVIFICTLILGWYFGRKYTNKEFETILLLFAFLMLILSVVVTVVDYKQTHELASRWRGIFWQKNHTGLFLCFISLLCLVNYIENFKIRNAKFYLSCGIYVASIAGIIANNSASAMIITLLVHGLVLALMIWHRYKILLTKKHYIILFVLLILVSLFGLLNLDVIFGLFGRNVSLTGRVPMWEQLFKLYFLKRPVFGYGFNAFWYQTSHRMVVGTVSHLPDILIADNGFIDILINNGVVGFILFMIFYIGLWGRSVQSIVETGSISGFMPLLMMLFILLGNLTWTMLFENESLYMLIMITMLYISEEKRIHQQRNLE